MMSSGFRPRLLLGVCGAISVLALPRAAAVQTAPRFVRSQLTWFDRAGKKLSVVGGMADYGNLELSPGADRVAVAVLGDAARGTRDLWIVDVTTGRHTEFTSGTVDENGSSSTRDEMAASICTRRLPPRAAEVPERRCSSIARRSGR
jgi:hypothetical protein